MTEGQYVTWVEHLKAGVARPYEARILQLAHGRALIEHRMRVERGSRVPLVRRWVQLSELREEEQFA